MASAYQKVTADGDIGVAGRAKVVLGVHVVSGGGAGTVILRNGTSTGDTAVINCVGVPNEGSYFGFGDGIVFPNGCYYDEDSGVSYALVIYREL